jgi:hypothetical protein
MAGSPPDFEGRRASRARLHEEFIFPDGIEFHDSFIAHELDARASTTTITLIGPQPNLVFV